MRDVLAGGILVTPAALGPVSPRNVHARRRRIARPAVSPRLAWTPRSSPVQPGQLASPLLKFGFPSLALH